jgi:D-alanyl-D-alanine carboxypeptidase
MNSQLTLLRLRTVAMMTTIAAGLLVGCNASSLADQRADALDKAIPAAMKRASVPGAIVGIWQDGREPYVRAFGVRDTATRQPMATDLYMRIGSNSKTFTVTAILMLADQGKLRLDDPIDRFVEGVPSGNQITLRQLAAMRSGLYDYSDDTNPKLPQQPFRQWTPRKLLEISFRCCFRRAATSTIPTPTRSCSVL